MPTYIRRPTSGASESILSKVVVGGVGQAEPWRCGESARGRARVTQAGEDERVLPGRGKGRAPQPPSRVREEPLAA